MMLLGWLLDRWYEHQRAIDIKTLWPICVGAASNIDEARMAFAIHAYMDPAWRCLGQEQFDRTISALEPPNGH